MNRRNSLKAIAGLGAAVLLLQARAQGQQGTRPYRIGIGTGSARNPEFRVLFKTQMQELGWLEDRDYVVVDSPSKELVGLETMIQEITWLLGQKVDLLLVTSTAGAVEAHRQTKTVPILMIASGYPVEAGVANSLARPGKNVTGNALYAGTGVWGKLLEVLREAKPGIKRVGILWGYVPPAFPQTEIDICYDEFRRAATALGLTIRISEVPAREQLVPAMEKIAAEGTDAVVISGWLTAVEGWRHVVDLTIKRMLPTISDFAIPAPPGTNLPRPLLVYSADRMSLWRQAIPYVDRILKGANPGDLPIQLPSRFEFTVNKGMAKAIGLTLPRSILLRADRVID